MDCKHGIACRWTPIALGWAAVWITLGGLASLQALCWNTGVAGTNSRKLLEESDTLPVLGALANAIWGFLAERFSERHLASGVMLLTAGSVLFLQTVRSPADAFIFAVFWGLTSRGEGTLVNIILAQYYGRGSYGTISGFVFPFNRLGLGFGPLISSLSYDLTGSYTMVFNIFIAVSLLTALLLWLAKKPALPARAKSSEA